MRRRIFLTGSIAALIIGSSELAKGLGAARVGVVPTLTWTTDRRTDIPGMICWQHTGTVRSGDREYMFAELSEERVIGPETKALAHEALQRALTRARSRQT